MQLDFSIVVPVYNRADIIKETIPHILSQEYENYEVIVVDDGSTDNTWDTLQTIKHPRLKIFKKNNAERAAARNFGGFKASGKYINFFDCDDEMYSNHLSIAKKIIDYNNNPELLHTCYEFKDEKGNILSKTSVPPEGTANHLIKNNFLACNTVFVRSDIFKQNPFNETRALSSAEDWEIWLRLVSRFPIVNTNEITFAIIEHGERSLNNISPEKIEARNLELNKALAADQPFLNFYGKKSAWFFANSLTFIALSFANHHSTKYKSLSYLSKAFATYPPILFSKRYLATIKNLFIRFER